MQIVFVSEVERTYVQLFSLRVRRTGMRDRGVPVHGAGMQAHLTASGTGQYRCPTPHAVQRNVRRLGELGLSVNISEMDVRYADVSGAAMRVVALRSFVRYSQGSVRQRCACLQYSLTRRYARANASG